MTEINRLLRDALRRVETVAQAALAHQPDGEQECYDYLRNALDEIGAGVIHTMSELIELEMKGKKK